ncbi:hypothetical protein RIF29_24966 [Crotalaria pallida]|uniref:Replication protein A 70 kDa DNA-binding subunit B/D first OB fold domain-containing protein n=1 Tax=Crotalaria pallida TaxID=3830 RepID=A0AAN9I0N5_CROPI
MLWKVPRLNSLHGAYNIHMVLMDSMGDEIQASVYGPLVHFFTRYMHEGRVYDFAMFLVTQNSLRFKATSHGYRLIFLFYTSFERVSSFTFPFYRMKPNSVDVVLGGAPEASILRDVVGVVTAVSSEKYYMNNGVRVKIIGIELCDEYGTFDCFLVDDYITEFHSHLSKRRDAHTTILLRLCKGQERKGRVVFYTVMHVSKLFVNPISPEILAFRKRMLLMGFSRSLALMPFEDSKSCVENELMGDFPPITLGLLKSVDNAGTYIVNGTIVGVSFVKKWYYYECSCKAVVTGDLPNLCCNICGAFIISPVQRIGNQTNISNTHLSQENVSTPDKLCFPPPFPSIPSSAVVPLMIDPSMSKAVDGKGKSILMEDSVENCKKPIKRSLAVEFDGLTAGPVYLHISKSLA